MRRLIRWLGRAAALLIALPVVYLLAAFGLGAWPTGAPAPAAPGNVPIHILSNGYHASFILPLRAAGIDWAERFPETDFAVPPVGASHVMFGWGDRDFYMNTRRLEDVRAATAFAALAAQGEGVLQVTMLGEPLPDPMLRRLELTPAQYQALAAYIDATLRRAAGRPILHAGKGYGRFDAFYAANGRYSLFYTCNEWVGEGLRRIGAPAGRWTPFAQSILWHL